MSSRFVKTIYCWVEIMFEEVSFKASSEGREGRAVTAKGREFQISAAKRQKARPPCCLSLKVGMRNVRSSEKEVMQIWTSSAKY